MPERSPENHCQTNTERPTARLVIHDTAVIASSAMLETTPPYCIEIGAGVVIGEGCWLQACSGNIIIEAGTVFGAGVLIVGWSRIGAFSSIGSGATLFEASITSSAAIAAHSVYGLPSRALPHTMPVAETTNEVDNLPDPWDERPASSEPHSGVGFSSAQPTPSIQPDQPIHTHTREGTEAVTPSHPPAAPTPPPPFPQVHPPKSPASFFYSSGGSVFETAPEPSPSKNTPESDTSGDASSNIPETIIEETSPDEPQQDDPAIKSVTDETTDETIVAQSISQSTHVYGRQYVNRIIDQILQRNTPET